MTFIIKDELLRHRYKKLAPQQQAQVEEIIKRHVTACKKLGVEPEIDPTCKEAIDMVVAGNWEVEQPLERPGVRWHYDVYTPPLREAA